MQRGLDLAPVGRVTATRRWVVGANQLHHLAGGILHHLPASHEVSVAQANLAPGREAIEPFGWNLHEVVALDIKLASEPDASCTGRGILRVVDRNYLFARASGIVVDAKLQRAQYGHASRRDLV